MINQLFSRSKRKLVALPFLVLLVACTSKDETLVIPDVKEDLSETKQEEVVEKVDSLFYKVKHNAEEQVLAIVWKSETEIAFRLSTSGGPCDFNQSGMAVSRKNGDFEIDEDENGESYPALEYFVKEEGALFSIRLEQQKKSTARISYEYESPADECDPNDQLVMRRINN